MLFCSNSVRNSLFSEIVTAERTVQDRPTNLRNHAPSYRDARTHLKKKLNSAVPPPDTKHHRRSLIRLLRPTRFACALHCAHPLARSLTSLTPSLVGWPLILCFFYSGPQCVVEAPETPRRRCRKRRLDQQREWA